jgi:hypothetical protein
VPEVHLARAEVECAEDDRQLESARAYGAGVEHREVPVASDEWDVRVTADDERRIASARQARSVRAEAGAVDGDV